MRMAPGGVNARAVFRDACASAPLLNFDSLRAGRLIVAQGELDVPLRPARMLHQDPVSGAAGTAVGDQPRLLRAEVTLIRLDQRSAVGPLDVTDPPDR